MAPTLLNLILEGCLRLDHWSRAEDLFYQYIENKQMKKSGKLILYLWLLFVGEMKEMEDSCLYQTMIIAYIKGQYFEKARNLLKEVRSSKA